MTLRQLAHKTKSIPEDEIGYLSSKETVCSLNTKTGWSVNLPILGTCRPTKVCADLCYGVLLGKPVAWTPSIKKNLRVLRYFKETPAQIAADRIHKEYVARKMDFIRWNGVGDLIPETVKVINLLAEQHPDMAMWVVTKKPEFIQHLNRTSPGLYIMFSLDSDPRSLRSKEIVKEQKHPRTYFSFLRTEADQDTLEARIIFNLQQKKKHLPFEDPRRCCPVDAGKIETKGACGKCRKCFSEGVLD